MWRLNTQYSSQQSQTPALNTLLPLQLIPHANLFHTLILAPGPNRPLVDTFDDVLEPSVLEIALDLFVNSQVLSKLVPSFEGDPTPLGKDAVLGDGAVV